MLHSLGLQSLRGGTDDPALNGLLRCAARVLDYPIVLVTLLDDERQYAVAQLGGALGELPVEDSFCIHALRSDALFEVPDASLDPRFAGNPLVTGEPFVRAYAGVPMVLSGQRVGALCTLDSRPRRLSESGAATLADLAQAVAAWLDARREHLELLEERIRSKERMQILEQLTELAPGMLLQFVVRPGEPGSITYVSRHAREMLGLQSEPDIRAGLRPLMAHVHPDDRGLLQQALQSAAIPPTPWRVEFRVELPGGARWRCAEARPTVRHDGGVLWHAYVNDIDEHVRFEALRSDKLGAERASAEKSAFLSRVSHELRNPLNAMLGFTQLLLSDERDPLTPRQRERVAHAHRAAELQLGLINDVLDLSRIEQGTMAFESTALALTGLVEGCAAMVAQLAETSGVRLVQAPASGPPPVVIGDRRALEQVVLNLLTNGIKYNRAGGELAVSVRSADGQAHIDVRDQGRGLSPEEIGRLFRPFERLGAASSNIPGTGLGLMISRQLIQAMDGSIDVHSRPGEGCTFTVTLPLHTAAAASAAPVEADTAFSGLDGDAAWEADAVTVLYVEDDPVNALLVQEALRSRPEWRLTHASNGRTGLALAQALQPRVLLADVNLPDISGPDIVRAMRADPQLRQTVCIALSADAMGHQIDEAMRAGFDAYWTKPLDVRALPRRIERWLRREADPGARDSMVEDAR